MSDPLEELFGRSAMSLFASKELVVEHGPRERLPEFMRTGPLADIESLCRHYDGALQVANGSADNGVQIAVSRAHASALLRLGLTVYFTELGRFVPPSRPWLSALDAGLGLLDCAYVVAFANAVGSGLSLHHDRFDQLLIQLQGEKDFRYAPNTYVENPDVQFTPFATVSPEWGHVYRNGFPSTAAEIADKELRTVTLRPGSALFMPAGTWHTTAGQRGESLSLVVVVPAPSRLTVLLNLLRDYAGQSPAWRARSYGAWGGPAESTAREQQALGALMVDLGERLRRLPAADAHRAWLSDAFVSGTHRATPADLAFPRYIRIPNASVRFTPEPTPERLRCTVRSGPTDRPQAETSVELNAVARAIVEWVLSTTAAFSVDDVSRACEEFPPDDVEALVAWLAYAGLIRPLPAPEWDEPPQALTEG